MKATVSELKKVITKRSVAYCGYKLSKNNVYYMNADYIAVVEDMIQQQKAEGADKPNLRYEVTEAQEKSLTEWVKDLKRTYLFS